MKERHSRRAHRPITTVSSILSSTLKAYRISEKVEQYEFFEYWEEIVGAKLSQLTFPQKITRGGVLIVRVQSTALVQELSLQKENFLEQLKLLASTSYISDIRFIVSDPKSLESHRQKKESKNKAST